MPKSAIINVERPGMIENVPFKKLLLLFDRLYVEHLSLFWAEGDITASKTLSTDQKDSFLNEIGWMKDQKLLESFILDRTILRSAEPEPALLGEINTLNEEIQANVIPDSIRPWRSKNSDEDRYLGIARVSNEMIFKAEDIRLRIGAIQLGLADNTTQFIPLLNSFESYRKVQSSDSALHFVLGKIPMPDNNTPWEQIISFRQDESVQRKYFALLNWINEISQKDLPLHHIADQYNQLYHEYLHQYKLHQLTSNYTTVELLLFNGIDIVSSILQQNFLATLKGLVHIRKGQVALLKAEKDIRGKELAYILAAENKFSK